MAVRNLHGAATAVLLLLAAADFWLFPWQGIDFFYHDTYRVVPHLHFILAGALLFGLCAALLYAFTALPQRAPHEGLAKLHFWLTCLGVAALLAAVKYFSAGGFTTQHHRGAGWVFLLIPVAILFIAAVQLLFPLSLGVGLARRSRSVH